MRPTALEVGTFTGYSALAVARGMGPGGRLLCCDVSEEWTAIAREYWEKAGVDDRIELRIGPAIETLRSLPNRAQFDLAFVDADKTGYPAYYEEIVPRLRPGGLLLADNTLQGGRVLDPDDSMTTSVTSRSDRSIDHGRGRMDRRVRDGDDPDRRRGHLHPAAARQSATPTSSGRGPGAPEARFI